MAEELVELRAAIQHELELARSGDGYEEKAVADEIVERIVEPMLNAQLAWALDEVDRLRREVEFEANGADNFSGADRLYSEARGEGEECSGREDPGQASREEAAEQTVGTGYPQGSGPGCGSATPAPPSSHSGSVFSEGGGTP